MSYSNGGGGTLTLPSPTHVHHVDVTSAVRSLRRSLSRSPSKFRLITKSPSPSPKSPLSPSPPKRTSSIPSAFTTSNPPHTPSPLAVPFPPSAKLALRSSTRTKTTPARPSSRTRTSPKSPMKRALNQASDSGNATPVSSAGSTVGQENCKSASPAERKSFERSTRMQFSSDISGPINQALSRLGGDGSNDFPSTTSSPLKRSDAIMNLDQASLGSPVAKRRSLHGSASFGHDFNVFDHGPSSSPGFDIHDELNHEYELSAASLAPENTSAYASLPRRSSSLRKSTLQQRHGEKTSWGRRHAAQVLAAQQLTQTAPEVKIPSPSKSRPRLSLDQFMPPMARDSPFSSQGSLPNASMHIATQPMPQPMHQPHPLSRTMTTSSSNSSLVDDSPTHVPLHFGEQPRSKLDFSKSLPAGSLRPLAFENIANEEKPFSTPQNYKSVKPLPAAFMSTGLISKVNRNPELSPKQRGASKPVPDTPCKKPFNGFATYPAPVPGSAIAKARHIRHSFGTPSTPFNPHGIQATPGHFGKGAGVFGSVFGGRSLGRRGSFISVDDEENGGSPDAKGDSQASDLDLPPTPTKQTLVQQYNNGSPSNHRSFPASMSAIGHGLAKKLTRTSSKLNLSTSLCDGEGEDSDGSFDVMDSPTLACTRPSLRTFESDSSIGNPLASRNSTILSPTPVSPQSLTTSLLSPHISRFAKISHVAPASPLERIDFIERLSPRTPQDSMLPPDPSGLSISNPRDGHAASQGEKVGMPPPATPTAGRDYFSRVLDRRFSTTPVSNFAAVEIDHSLLSRFEKVETIGSGEFSNVYLVTQTRSNIFDASRSFFFNTSGSPSSGEKPPALMPTRVFAVKKSRQPFQGTRDRQRKLQEVNVLKALSQSDHVVHLIDSWEEKNHLYIQTEYCEEGTLDVFLTTVGQRGKLDVFRIWKVLLEISQGLQHIHNSGFIHLDLKPANIFITFEGVLKIGDFGMATSWPAEVGIETEGDRDYIAPEILLGTCDKPADVFALGIIMFEIAGNVKLPENGPSWLKLRRGDTSDVPSLTFSESILVRDATGLPIDDNDITMESSFCSDDELETDFGSPKLGNRKRNALSNRSLSHDPGNLFGSVRRGELHQPPAFMLDSNHPDALDHLVQAMLRENPEERPIISQVLEAQGLQWVNSRCRAGATVFEGEWGPADEILAHDSEMIDV